MKRFGYVVGFGFHRKIQIIFLPHISLYPVIYFHHQVLVLPIQRHGSYSKCPFLSFKSDSNIVLIINVHEGSLMLCIKFFANINIPVLFICL